MEVIILNDAQSVAIKGAELVGEMLRVKPGAVFGFATGRTPIDLYHHLVEQYRSGNLSFKNATSFNLDEYLGIPGSSPQSYRSFMDREFFDHIDIDKGRTHVPACEAGENPRLVGRRYESMILEAGGIDLQVLGIGHNGHIGFNEPSSSLASRTRVKTLKPETLEDNSQFFSAGDFQPKLAITVGIATIMDARGVMLLATGENKAKAVGRMVEGPVTSMCPASVLQMHEFATVLLDKAAAAGLRHRQYYDLACQANEVLKNRFGTFYADA